MQYTDEQLVARYLEMRRFIEAEAEAQEAHLKPYVEGMATISGELHRRLLERNPDWKPGMKASGTAGGGTFFLKTDTSIKMADREAFFRFVADADDFETLLFKMQKFLTAHVAKEGVEEYQSTHDGAVPPGITFDQIAKLVVRKT